MKRFLLFAVVLFFIACNGRFGAKTTDIVGDGHNYQWIAFGDKIQLVHSPECDTCKIIRKREIIEVVDSIIKERKTISINNVE